ncbi:MFS transporter [Catenulispora rubra]|uniref:MFS transporter n=1 Tax=Catenulispora rubra TaxID=280293 RepID=UPI00189204CC|nr:MFS transporter [Catenulispora rubra]
MSAPTVPDDAAEASTAPTDAAASDAASSNASPSDGSAKAARPRVSARTLLRASGGPRYAVALLVDSFGNGMLRPFLLLYGIDVLHLSAPTSGVAMTVGIIAGLAATPAAGRWLDTGARSTVVAVAMLVRVLGTVLLLAAPTGSVVLFTAGALFLGIGNQTMPAAHSALIATIAKGRERDAASAAARSVRNAGMGLGALAATACLAGGPTAMRWLAVATGFSFLGSASLAWSVHIRAQATSGSAADVRSGPGPALPTLLAANVMFVFCVNVPEIALPLILVKLLHASPVWAAGIFVTNTALVVAFQVPVTIFLARWPRSVALAASGVVIAVSYVGFLLTSDLGHGFAAAAVAGVSVLCTIGEIMYAGSISPLLLAITPPQVLGRTLGRFQLSNGMGLAISPTVIAVLASHGSAALWLSLAAGTLLAAWSVRRLSENEQA